MTLLERLQAHKGGLIRIKTQLFWYGGGWDRNPGRVCLILDAAAAAAAAVATAAAHAAAFPDDEASTGAVALLLIDGASKWIWVAEADVEVLNDPS